MPYFSKYSSAQERKSFFDTLLDFASLSSRANVFRSMVTEVVAFLIQTIAILIATYIIKSLIYKDMI